jgi:mRNA-degrading endonuclease RelE of RelBE toxin-antitoxin system
MPYEIIFEPDAVDHLRSLSGRDRATVLDGVEKQLTYEPGVETRHRKRLRPNLLAPWELRRGNLRVFYDVYEEPTCVRVVAVGYKRGNKLIIAGQEISL